MGFLSKSKDKLAESMAPSFLNNSVLKPYGRIIDLKLDSEAKTLAVTLELKGEREPVKIDVQEYELRQEGERSLLVIKGVSTSREWLTELAERLVVGRPFELPPQASTLGSQFL